MSDSGGGMALGLYRILPVFLQNLAVSLLGSKRWLHETGPGFQKMVQRLLDQHDADAGEIRSYRNGRLAEVLKAASHTRFYGDMLPDYGAIEEDPEGVLASLPVLSRDGVLEDPEAFINPDYSGRLIRHGTSGTTGTPLQIYWTPECIEMERALIWRQRICTGLHFGRTWRGMLGGHQVVPLSDRHPPYWRVNRLAKQVYLSTYHLSPDTASDYHSCLQKYSITHLEGYPSVLYALARSLREKGLQYELEGIYYGAEPLQDFQRECIEDVFSCYVWDYYGLTERVASASEFECRNGLHENWENCYLEVVDENGRILPEGEYGELVGTSLSNLGFPLLRYRTGDMTRFLEGRCECGRASRRIAAIDTKREDLLVMPDGSLLSASNLTYPFKEVANIEKSQIRQIREDRITVLLVPGDSYSEADGRRLLEGLCEMVPPDVSIELQLVRDIPRLPSGKYAFCVSDVELSSGRSE